VRSRGAGKLHTGSKAWRAVRQRVLERDDFKCQLRLPGCKAVADEVDHSVPREVGGVLYDEANLRASCGSCNRSQGNRAGTPLGSMAIDRRRFSTSSGVGSSATAHHAERALAPLLASSTGGG
jgi:5-methylcytosine-specific restriction endonuclease McrA